MVVTISSQAISPKEAVGCGNFSCNQDVAGTTCIASSSQVTLALTSAFDF
jgi:hypothetical protein